MLADLHSYAAQLRAAAHCSSHAEQEVSTTEKSVPELPVSDGLLRRQAPTPSFIAIKFGASRRPCAAPSAASNGSMVSQALRLVAPIYDLVENAHTAK